MESTVKNLYHSGTKSDHFDGKRFSILGRHFRMNRRQVNGKVITTGRPRMIGLSCQLFGKDYC